VTFTELLPWVAFLALIAALLFIDLGILHRRAHAIGRREALIMSAIWISLALIFNAGVFIFRGTEDGIEWLTGYVVEESLSIDNVFVFLLIFSTFGVPAKYQHRVLFWGIFGAIVMRAILIGFAGVLVHSFHFVIYIFGAFLILTGIRFLRSEEEVPSLDSNPLVRVARRFFPVTNEYDGQKLFTRHRGKLMATPLLLVLLLIESSDLVFAVDSVPAIYAITRDPFIVYTSNIFAILGLRSIYFVLAGYLAGMKYLKPGLAAVLVFVGTKMLLADLYHIPPLASLLVILAILSVAFGASFYARRQLMEEVEAAVSAEPRP
jgi:tellurite resistance protein TerC